MELCPKQVSSNLMISTSKNFLKTSKANNQDAPDVDFEPSIHWTWVFKVKFDLYSYKLNIESDINI